MKYINMKKLFSPLVVFIFLFTSCQAPTSEELPDTIDELKVEQKRVKDEMSTLNERLESIRIKMQELNPDIFEKPKKLVTGLSLSKDQFNQFIDLQGSVIADETVFVSSETGGRLLQLNVREGDRVTKGKVIARVDLESINKQMDEVNTSLDLAREIYARQKRLWDQNIGTEVQYLEAKNAVERLEKSLETLQFNRNKATVVAPISGEVAVVNKEQGEVSAPGEPIATILNTYKLKVSIDIPENLIPSVKRGQTVQVDIPAIGYSEPHRITRIGSQVDINNRTVPVEVVIYNKSGLIKPNLLATMAVREITVDDALTIPTFLLQQEVSGKYFVYVIKDKDADVPIVEKRIIKVGNSYGGQIVVTDGLTEDDVLVNDGARQVANGDHLMVESVAANHQTGVE